MDKTPGSQGPSVFCLRLFWKAGRAFQPGQLFGIGARDPHFEDVVDDGIVIVAETGDRAQALHIDLAVTPNGVIANVNVLDPGEDDIHGAFRAIPRKAVRAEIAALEMNG